MTESLTTDLIGGGKALALVWAVIVGFWLLKVVVLWCVRAAGHLLYPLVAPLLGWLQDRATARTLGIDIDVLRFRRKVDFPVTDRPE